MINTIPFLKKDFFSSLKWHMATFIFKTILKKKEFQPMVLVPNNNSLGHFIMSNKRLLSPL